MSKLTDTQAVILSAASQRPGRRILPLPDRLKGGAVQKVVAGLLSRGLAEEAEAGHEDPVWREAEGQALTLVATDSALKALGVEPDSAPDGATQPQESGSAGEGDRTEDAAQLAHTGADAPKVRAGTKQARLIEMLRAPDGATSAEIAEATGWQPHTVRGAIAGALKKKLGLAVTSEKVEGRGRVCRIR